MGTVAALPLAVALLAPAPAGAACGAPTHLRPHHEPRHGRAPLLIGDSVVLGAAGRLARAGFEVNAHGCRQMAEGLRFMRARRRGGRLPRIVIVALGTNWNVTGRDVRRALAIAGPQRLLVLVTPRELGGGAGSDARVMRAAGRRHPRRIAVADWVRVSAGHPGWFAGDGIHLGVRGVAGMVRMLRPYLRTCPTARRPVASRGPATARRSTPPRGSGGCRRPAAR